jgi:hypothetical protein
MLEINHDDITTKRIFFLHAASCSLAKMWVLRLKAAEFDVLWGEGLKWDFIAKTSKRKEGQIRGNVSHVLQFGHS